MDCVRVIAGTYRSRVLSAPRGLATRPTADRLRETLFNVLAPRVPGAVFADLYAGSGANGIEALSRGAAQVFLVENATPALAAIRSNLKSLAVTEHCTVEPRSVSAFLRRMVNDPRKLDIVFLDPPYENLREYATTLLALGTDCAAALAPDAIVVAEHRRKQPLDEHYAALTRYRVLEQSDAALSFYRLPAKESPAPGPA